MEAGTVYADVLALINFSMDFVALRITSSVLRLKPRLWRSIFGAVFGALYSIAALLLGIDGFWQILADAVVALLICVIVYGAKDAFRWLMASGMFFAVGFIMGGAMTALYSRVGEYTKYLSEGGNILLAEGAIDGRIFVLLCVISAAITAAVGRIISYIGKKKSCTLDIVCSGRSTRLFCVCDSGNLVREPISGLPVIFISEESAAFLTNAVLKYLKTGDSGECESQNNLRVVPVNTVDGSSIKYAVKCDSVTGEKGAEYGAVLALSATMPRGVDGIAPSVFGEVGRKKEKYMKDMRRRI